ncbi:MAG: chorismate mutase [Rhodospirillales bacterium]|nr:chorismate mutase [Rhodospirillales bacterium]MCB9995885.1 chorismate mutase [Rhodospirillales bacterium]
MSKTVGTIRQQIDALDDKIHDLLMKRAEMVVKIGEEKRKNKVQIIQPDREAIMIRRLLGRHQGPLPKEAIVRIWRELVGAVSLLQTGLKVVVSVPEDHTGLIYWDMAKDYFSSVLPMQKASNPLAALAMVRESEATFAVLPWPEDDQNNPWWGYIMDENGDQGMRIMARLPLGDSSKEAPNLEHRAIVVARLKYETSGDDRSFLALDLDGDISRGRIVDKAQALELKALSLHSCPGMMPGRKLHLVEVEGYVDPDGEQSEKLARSFDDPDAKCTCLGGYPVPPVYEDKVGKNAVPDSQQQKTA